MDQFIKLLLETENTVILPGFGAIVVENENTGKLMFNEYLKFNDGKLDQIIISNSKMDLQEAQNYIAKHIREIQNELGKGESYDIFGLGSFKKDNDGSVIFEGNRKSEQAETSKKEIVHGPSPTPPPAPSVEEKETPSTELRNLPSTELRNRPSSEPSSSNSEETRNIDSEELRNLPNEKPVNQKRRRKKPVFWVLLILLLLIGSSSIFVALNYDYVESYMGWKDFAVVDDIKNSSEKDFSEDKNDEINNLENANVESSQEIIESDPLIESEQGAQELEIQSNEEQENQFIEEEQKEVDAEPVTPNKNTNTTPIQNSVSGDFHVIVGSFGSLENAKKLESELIKQGHSGQIIGQFKGLHYVSAGGFSTSREASNYRSKVAEISTSAWVFRLP